ncbi:hypothetical protein Sango_1062800 [Sesamum angolense]|uniref:Uncharacterized protein n=1 Tax=Sesamum angolense TaxID=2727404 RepID=A0AAE2BZ95_9LAMI|nr:hypothetical protein Sango_1062800 [Sesamum angolense]
MGFSRKDVNVLVDDDESSGSREIIREESERWEFCPIQHPNEPPQEDKPVECPLPHSSVINEARVSSRGSFQRTVWEPKRKRHHSNGHGDHYGTQSLRRAPHVTMLEKASTVEQV